MRNGRHSPAVDCSKIQPRREKGPALATAHALQGLQGLRMLPVANGQLLGCSNCIF